MHLHTAEDVLIYVLSGRGAAIVGDNREWVPIETGSLLYIPIGEWHSLQNADPKERMEILLVTTPVRNRGLGAFFRNAAGLPGFRPVNLSDALFRQYGMEVPAEPSAPDAAR